MVTFERCLGMEEDLKMGDVFVFWIERLNTSRRVESAGWWFAALLCLLLGLIGCGSNEVSSPDLRSVNVFMRPAGAVLLYRDRPDPQPSDCPLVPDSKVAYDLAALLSEDPQRSAWPQIVIAVRNQGVTFYGAEALDIASRTRIEEVVMSLAGVRSFGFSSWPPPSGNSGYVMEFVP